MANLTSEQIAWLVESTEAAAWADYYRCAPLDFAYKYGVQVQQAGSAWVTLMSGVDSWFFNRINGLGLESATTQDALDGALGVLTSAGCKEYTVQLSPLAQPPELEAWLKARGLCFRSNWAKMYRDASPAPSARCGLRIERIGPDAAEAYGRIVLETFEMPAMLLPMMSGHIGQPGWSSYLGYDGDRPVCTASMFVSGDVAWLGMGSTLAPYRGRGAQSAMFARRIEDGLQAGCQWFVTETGEDTPQSPNPSYRNMRRAGFKLAYMRPNYVTAGSLT